MGRSRSEDPGTTCPAAVLSDDTKLAPRARPSFLTTRGATNVVLPHSMASELGFGDADLSEGTAETAMSLSLLKFAGQASLVDKAMLPS